MRINNFNNYNFSNPTFTSNPIPKKTVSRCPVPVEDINKIVELIQRSDESRLDGTPQGLYQYGKFMVKTPDKTGGDTAIKEFFALTKIRNLQGDDAIAPMPGVVSKFGNRHFLVEEFVKGSHKDGEKLTLDEVKGIFDKLILMDKGGIINEDLSPRNIMHLEDGTQKIVDFDHFSFIGEEGKIYYSQSTPTRYFITRTDKAALQDIEHANAAGSKLREIADSTIETRFANSFLYNRRVPQGLHDLSQARNMSDNPYINVPSNMSSYEARTIYRKIKDSDVEEPIEFLRDYIQLKARNYHTQMRDFLKTLRITEDTGAADIPFYEAERRLNLAIEYEDFLVKLFGKDKPDVYFAKLEAAKIQFEAFLHKDDINRSASNKERLHCAYERLIKVITEGIDLYADDEQYTKYLNNELSRYRDTFANTDFSIASAKKGAIGSFDILDVWFSDRSADSKSIPSLRSAAKKAGLKSARGFFGNGGGKTAVTDMQAINERRGVIYEAVQSKLRESGDRVTEKNFQKVANEIVDEIVVAIRNGKLQDNSSSAQATLARTLKEGEKLKDVGVYEAAGRTVMNIDNVKTGDIAKDFYKTTCTHQRYSKQGGKIFAAMAAICAVGGYAAYKYVQYKKDMEIKQLEKERRIEATKINQMSNMLSNTCFGKMLK